MNRFAKELLLVACRGGMVRFDPAQQPGNSGKIARTRDMGDSASARHKVANRAAHIGSSVSQCWLSPDALLTLALNLNLEKAHRKVRILMGAAWR